MGLLLSRNKPRALTAIETVNPAQRSIRSLLKTIQKNIAQG